MSSGSGFHNTAVVECVSKVIGQIPDHSYLSVSLSVAPYPAELKKSELAAMYQLHLRDLRFSTLTSLLIRENCFVIRLQVCDA